jgi:flagellar hook assembly protein FlgD
MPIQTRSQFQPQSEQRFYHNHAHTVNRDGKNGAGDVMHDGIYHIWIEDTSTNSAINGMPNGIYFT